MTAPATVQFPDEGVWRIGRAPDPLEWHRPDPVDTSDPGGGNRFDSFHGDFAVLYFGTTPRACFAETLARFRVRPAMHEIVRHEWADRNWMYGGSVAADWRDSRMLVRVGITGALPFVDIAASDTLNAFAMEPRVRGWLAAFGISDVDLATVVGTDRRVTRLLSQWVFESLDDGAACFGGIRYASRLGADHECWAVFEGTAIQQLERRPILTNDPELIAVAADYNVVVH